MQQSITDSTTRFFTKDLSNFANIQQYNSQNSNSLKDTLKIECKNQQNPNFSSFVSVGDESTYQSRISTQNSESLQRSSKTVNNLVNSNNIIFDEDEEEENQTFYTQNNNTVNNFHTNNNDKNTNNNNNINFATFLENNNNSQTFHNNFQQNNKQMQSRFQNFFQNNNQIQQQDIPNQLLTKFQQQFESKPRENPQHVVQYQKEIIQYLLKIENKYTPQNLPISTEQRGALVDWLINHQCCLKLKCETLHISIYIMDQYLEIKYKQNPNNNISVTQFYWIACTSLFMAAKYEEIYPPSLDQFCNQMQFQKADIIECEGKILNTIGFTLTAPTSLKFLEAFALIDQKNISANQVALAQFLIQLALHHAKFLYIKPSLIASVSILIAKKLFDLQSEVLWTPLLQEYSGYKQEDLEELGNQLFLELLSIQSSPGSAICIKFSSKQFQQITQQIPYLLSSQMYQSQNNNNDNEMEN